MASLEYDENDLKMLGEALMIAQSLMSANWANISQSNVKRIQKLIDEVHKHRPIGSDGKHGMLHTRTCGCQDKGHGEWCAIGRVGDIDREVSYYLCEHARQQWYITIVNDGRVYDNVDDLAMEINISPKEAVDILFGKMKNYTGLTFDWRFVDAPLSGL